MCLYLLVSLSLSLSLSFSLPWESLPPCLSTSSWTQFPASHCYYQSTTVLYTCLHVHGLEISDNQNGHTSFLGCEKITRQRGSYTFAGSVCNRNIKLCMYMDIASKHVNKRTFNLYIHVVPSLISLSCEIYHPISIVLQTNVIQYT